ncbi:MAG: trigger factor, partial [Brachybacterium sp.]
VKVTAQSVKVRELPEADDEFAEMASEFDTIDELKDDLKKQAAADAEGNRVALARNALLEKLLEELEIPVPQQLVEDEILSHLENEGKEAGDPHGEEIREETEKAVRAQFLLDEINGTREVNVDQSDLMNYMTQLSTQYGIESNQLLQMLAQSGQLEQIFGEVQRSKALEVVLADVTVKNAAGDVLDLGLEAEGDDDAEKADAEEMPKAKAKKAPAKKAESDEETDAAEEKPKAKKAPAKKAPAKKAAAAEETDAAEEKPKAKKAPAKKTAAKKAESDEASESK